MPRRQRRTEGPRKLPTDASVGTVFATSLTSFLTKATRPFADLLSQAEKIWRRSNAALRQTSRARAILARHVSALRFSTIRARRVAFLGHASEAVFGERLEPRDVRKLVRDLSEKERRTDAEYQLGEEIFAEARNP